MDQGAPARWLKATTTENAYILLYLLVGQLQVAADLPTSIALFWWIAAAGSLTAPIFRAMTTVVGKTLHSITVGSDKDIVDLIRHGMHAVIPVGAAMMSTRSAAEPSQRQCQHQRQRQHCRHQQCQRACVCKAAAAR